MESKISLEGLVGEERRNRLCGWLDYVGGVISVECVILADE